MKNNHIKSLKIKQFKCFSDFEIKDLKRVNLITGKNNAGKTALLEAGFLANGALDVKKNGEHYPTNFSIISLLIKIKQNREPAQFLAKWLSEEFDLTDFNDFEIDINQEFNLKLKNPLLSAGDLPKFNINKFRESEFYHNAYKKNKLPILGCDSFISLCQDDQTLKKGVDKLKIDGQYDAINNHLKALFDIEQIDFIEDMMQLKKAGKYQPLREFGDGIRHFLNTIVTLSALENKVIYIDEIDNGIHYSLFDELWQIVLKISKQQDIQVFATTHSKECIESYNRVVKKLSDKDITCIRLSKIKSGKINPSIYDYEVLASAVKQEHDIR